MINNNCLELQDHELLNDLQLYAGANMNGSTSWGESPFQLFLQAYERLESYNSAVGSMTYSLEQFLVKGANPNTLMPCGKPLLEYILTHRFNCLEHGVFPQRVQESYLHIVKILCETSDVDAMKSGKYYPLHTVLVWDTIRIYRYVKIFQEILQLLLSRGLDINQRNSLDLSPLGVLFCYTLDSNLALELTSILLDAGADPLEYLGNGEFVIYSALRKHSRAQPELTELMLMAKTNCALELPLAGFALDSNSLTWWHRTQVFLRSKLWHSAKDHILDPANILPKDVGPIIIKISLEAIGRACVTYYHSQYNQSKDLEDYELMISHGDYLLGMFKDFRSLKLFSTETWYDVLIDISSDMMKHMS